MKSAFKYSILLFFIFNRCLLSEISYKFIGKLYFPENILKDQIVNSKQYVDIKDQIENDINILTEFYASSGFPLCSIKVIEIEENDQMNFCTLNINSGNYVVIGFIEYKDSPKTKAEYLNLQSRIGRVSEFNEEKVYDSMNYLYKTGLFKSRPEFQIVRKKGSYGLSISLEEKKYYKCIFTGGVIAADKSTEFVGAGEFNADNILGTNRKAAISWSRKSENNEKIYLSYREPNLIDLPVSLKGEYEQQSDPGLDLKRKYVLTGVWDFNAESDLLLNYSMQKIFPDSNNIDLKSDIEITSYGGGIKYSTLYNDLPIPNECGNSIQSQVNSLTNDFIGNDSTNSIISIDLTGKNIFKMKKGIFLSVKYRYAHLISSDDIPAFNKILFGGVNSLKGYRDDIFITDCLISTNLDIIYVPQKDIAFSLFIDNSFYNSVSFNLKKIGDMEPVFGYGTGIIYSGVSHEIEFYVGIPEKGFSEAVAHVKYSLRF